MNLPSSKQIFQKVIIITVGMLFLYFTASVEKEEPKGIEKELSVREPMMDETIAGITRFMNDDEATFLTSNNRVLYIASYRSPHYNETKLIDLIEYLQQQGWTVLPIKQMTTEQKERIQSDQKTPVNENMKVLCKNDVTILVSMNNINGKYEYLKDASTYLTLNFDYRYPCYKRES